MSEEQLTVEKIEETEAARWSERLRFIYDEFQIDCSGLDSGDLLDGVEHVARETIARLKEQIEELEMKICDECLEYEDNGTPQTTYGWNENREEGQHPCICISESGPYQVLEAKLATIERDTAKTCRQLARMAHEGDDAGDFITDKFNLGEKP